MGVQPPDDLWSTLEEQPLLSSRAGGEGMKKKKKGILRRSVAWACAPLRELWALARADPRKPVFAAKVALALALVSLLGFVREPSNIVVHSVWAILTVVVVFEYTIGATLSRGSNRALGTLIAGGLAIVVAESAKNLGKMEEVVIILSTFTVGFFTTLAKQHPRLKPYEYGFRVFLLTFGYVMVSGYITGNFTETAVSRFLFIALGAGVSLGINIGIYPIWAGEELHNLIEQNFSGVANSLVGINRLTPSK